MNDATFPRGFWFSRQDAVVLAGAALCSVGLGMWIPWVGILVATVVVHFFLFCNVFRIPRFLELVWAALFIVVSAPVILHGVPAWYVWLALVLICTVAVIAVALRLQSYRGAFWRVVNPDLLPSGQRGTGEASAGAGEVHGQ